ncbi:MAG: polynucleotide adenylyltransferase PcnB [Chromatiales bacterium]|nr:polynucleotide adenylyltransferase PcnB [Chromatiales bacterium]
MLNWILSKVRPDRGGSAGTREEAVDANQVRTVRVLPRSEHNISRSQISPNALKVLYRLKNAGYQAYLVGGGVRDLLLGREPKDFDVGTDASPEQVKEVFRNCRLIGRRFRLAHVHFGREIIEVATFRAHSTDDEDGRQIENGRLVRDNVYGTIEEDAWRRDFTVNALYYDINDFSVVDYTGGVEDLRQGLLRMIGEPGLRFREDPVRMLRAVRFAVKLGFKIDPASEHVIQELGDLLDGIAAARLFDEVLKLFLAGYGLQTFEALRHYDLFRHLFPDTDHCLEEEENQFPITFVAQALKNTDERVSLDKPVTPAFLFAALLWEPLRREMQVLGELEDVPPVQLVHRAADDVLRRQVDRVAIPRRFSQVMREVWTMQPRFEIRSGKRALRLLEHPKFRAGFDFLLLRAQAGEVEQEVADFWIKMSNGDEQERSRLTRPAGASTRRRRPRRRRKPRTPAEE